MLMQPDSMSHLCFLSARLTDLQISYRSLKIHKIKPRECRSSYSLQLNTDQYKRMSKIITGPCVGNTRRVKIQVQSTYYLGEINNCCLGFIRKPTDDMISPFSNDTELIHKGSRELD